MNVTVEAWQENTRVYIPTRREGQENAQRLVSALKQCSRTRDLKGGKKLHHEAVAAGCHRNRYVATALIKMYIQCRSMQCAKQVFDSMPHRDAVTWTCLILGYVENGQSSAALDFFSMMDCEPTHVTYRAALKACTCLATEKESLKKSCLEKGKAIHKRLKERGYDSNIVLANTLVDMYGKCGSMQSAKEVFDRMVHKNVVTWTCLTQGYVENNESSLAMEFFTKMDCEPDSYIYAIVLKACASLKDTDRLEKGMAIHKQVKERGYHSDSVVGNALIHMYGKSGSMQRAKEVFDGMIHKSVITWTSLILGYVENGESLTALDVFSKMDCEPNCFTYVAVLKACGGLACLEKGIAIHKQVKECRLDSNVVVASTLLVMYGKCGNMERAKEVFDRMVYKNVVTWTCLILGYVENGESFRAMELFRKMDCDPDCYTYVAAVRACAGLVTTQDSDRQFHLQEAITIHEQIKKLGYSNNVILASALVDMYAKCGSMKRACEVFESMSHKNVVTWTSLIQGYVENGESHLAMSFFTKMDSEPDCFTYVAAVKACASLAMEEHSEKEVHLEKGVTIHKQVVDCGYISDMLVASSLVDMYGKCGSIQRAREVFDGMLHKDVVTWSSLIMGYVENGESFLALDLFAKMECEPDCFTYVAALKACGNLSALRDGRCVHMSICKVGLEGERLVATTLVEFYGRCGNMVMAEEMFGSVYSPDIALWNAFLAGYASLGESSQVFSWVKKIDVQMDEVTFIYILTACSHGGLVEKGKAYFDYMIKRDISPNLEHYNCLVDMLSRSNRVDEALDMVKNMPVKPNVVTWMSLLYGCTKHRNMDAAKVAFDALLASGNEQDAAAACVLMGDVYKGSLGEV